MATSREIFVEKERHERLLEPAKKIQIKVKEYALTLKGKKYYTKRVGIMKALHGFIVGKAAVTEIVNFTQPAMLGGVTISRVTYNLSPVEIYEWAKGEAMIGLFPELKRLTQKDQRTETLILTNNGWVHEKDIIKGK